MPSVVEWVRAMSSGSATSTAAIVERASPMRSVNARNCSTFARPTASSLAAWSSIAFWTSAGIGPALPAFR